MCLDHPCQSHITQLSGGLPLSLRTNRNILEAIFNRYYCVNTFRDVISGLTSTCPPKMLPARSESDDGVATARPANAHTNTPANTHSPSRTSHEDDDPPRRRRDTITVVMIEIEHRTEGCSQSCREQPSLSGDA